MKITIFIILTQICCLAESVGDINYDEKDLEEITPDDYLSFDKDFKTKHFILFHHPYCVWCKEIRTELVKLSVELSQVQFHAINCVKHKLFCQTNRINSYPKMYIKHGYLNAQCYDRKYELIKKFINNFK